MTARVHLVAGARPNFMKIAPLWHALKKRPDLFSPAIVHTGQHYDPEMSGVFLEQLRLPTPDHGLGAGSGSHAEQTGAIMVAYEQVCRADRPDWVVVVGDVNSTLAAALAAKKMQLRVAHLEAGLRSFDRTMPEEINRVVTDSIADLLWTPSPDADANLMREGAAQEKVERVGNIMIDSLEMLGASIAAANWPPSHGMPAGGYGVVTLHRPSNVDDPARLSALVRTLERIARRVPLVFPLHPRTRRRLEKYSLIAQLETSGVMFTPPLGYIDFMSAVTSARFALTDSGGVQEETTYLGLPCLTLRDNTERPVTVTEGSNRLVQLERLEAAVDAVLAGPARIGRRPELWDGRTAARVVASLERRIA